MQQRETIELRLGERKLVPTKRMQQIIEMLIQLEPELLELHSGKLVFDIKGKKIIARMEKSIMVSHPGGTVVYGALDKRRADALRSG